MKENNSIKSWAEDDRPREKLILKGKLSLSDAELLAIILGSGSRDETAVDLAKRILISSNNNWNELAKLSINDLSKFKGIGEAKAINIIAALEISHRRLKQQSLEKPMITSSKDVFGIMSGYVEDLAFEEFWAIFLNRANKVISIYKLSSGGIHETTVDIKLLLKNAIENLAIGLILVHNHPSGNLTPSTSDKQITNKINEACKLLDIKLLDHLIIANKEFYSFADEGII